MHGIECNAITHRRRVAKQGGCFQRCLFVCPHDNYQTWRLGTLYKNLD